MAIYNEKTERNVRKKKGKRNETPSSNMKKASNYQAKT